MTEDSKVNQGIALSKKDFINCNGLFREVYTGKLTAIAEKLTKDKMPLSQADTIQQLIQRDAKGRTPLDIACHLGFTNIVLYLQTKMGTSGDLVFHNINVDDNSRSCYHILCYKGGYQSIIQLLNFERINLKKVLFDQLCKERQKYRMKNMNIKNGKLLSTIFHDADTVQRHEDFSIRVVNLLRQYSEALSDRYRQILCQQDIHGRNPLHYVCMNKFTKCYKTLTSLMDIDFDMAPGYEDFLKLYFQLQPFETNDELKFDPRNCNNILKEFKHLLVPREYNNVIKEFKESISLLLKEVLSRQDANCHSPLHVASYFGDFKASRFLVKLGAQPTSAAFAERPLEVGKDKFSRGVLQTLNKAASQSNSKDLKYLVNCGNEINKRESIFGEAPIHKAVLSVEDQKEDTLETIISCNANLNNIDSNGWTALHHAAYTGDLQSATMLLQNGATIDSYSNQQRTPLHLAALNNHLEVLQLLLENSAELEWMDDQKCTPLHLTCKKGSYECLVTLLQKGANIYAQDARLWTPLHYAAYNGHPLLVNTLAKWEADNDLLKDMRSSQNKTPLHICKNPQSKKAFDHIWRAAREGNLDLVRVLIREGQHINEQTQAMKNTPLHMAAKHGHLLIVKFLIESGAHPQLANQETKSPLELAEESRILVEQQVMKKKSHLKKGLDPAQAAVILDNLEQIKALLFNAPGHIVQPLNATSDDENQIIEEEEEQMIQEQQQEYMDDQEDQEEMDDEPYYQEQDQQEQYNM